MTTDAKDIRDAIYARAQTIPEFVTFRKTPLKTAQPDLMPALAVYIMDEDRDSDSDSGVPYFETKIKIGIAGVVIGGADDEALELKLDDLMDALEEKLLRDPAFVMMTERILSIGRRHFYPRIGETPIAEIRIEMVFQIHEEWEPIIPDDFLSMNVETRFPTSDTDPDEVQQVHTPYDIPQN